MSVLSKEELFKQVQEKLKDDTSDETLKFVEDFTDTVNDMEQKLSTTDSEWKKKYEENDNEWKKKYKDRFFSGVTTPEKVKKETKEDVKKDGESISFDDLFKEREGN